MEATNARAEAYGDERLAALVRHHGKMDAPGLLRRIEADRKDHCRGQPPKDNVTVLVVQSRASG